MDLNRYVLVNKTLCFNHLHFYLIDLFSHCQHLLLKLLHPRLVFSFLKFQLWKRVDQFFLTSDLQTKFIEFINSLCTLVNGFRNHYIQVLNLKISYFQFTLYFFDYIVNALIFILLFFQVWFSNIKFVSCIILQFFDLKVECRLLAVKIK